MRASDDGGQPDPPPIEETLAVPSSDNTKPVLEFTEHGLALNNTTDLLQFAQLILSEGLAPKGLRTRGQIVIALQAGAEVGLKPMQSLNYIAVINGRAAIWGEGAKGLVEASGKVEGWTECWEVDGEAFEDPPAGAFPDSLTAATSLSRTGGASVTRRFSVADAKRARLWGKKGPWTEFPKRMLRVRSMAWAMRDLFADCLGGLAVREELQDYSSPLNTVREVEAIAPRPAE